MRYIIVGNSNRTSKLGSLSGKAVFVRFPVLPGFSWARNSANIDLPAIFFFVFLLGGLAESRMCRNTTLFYLKLTKYP